MAQAYFIWNNRDCRSMGITMRGNAPIIRPEERVEHIEIPGRSGDLTQLQGNNIFNSYIQTVTFSAAGGFRVREIYAWLRGAGYVTFSGEPDRKQQARVIGAITLTKISRNMDRWAGECQFYCQPLKEKLFDSAVAVTSSGTAVMNTGDVDAKPMIKVTPNGASATVAAGGKSLTVTGLTSGTVIWIDSDAMEVLNADKTAVLTKDSSGDFPVLKPGSNSVTGSGWSRLDIERRERFL